MTSATVPKTSPSPWSVELVLVIGLPLASIIIASTLAYAAYVHGFTEIPKQTQQHVSAHR